MGGQEFFHLFVEPSISFIMLTGRTVPIPATTGNGLYGATVMTAIHNRAESTTAAISDILHGFFMDARHSVTMQCQIVRPVYLEDCLNSTHDNTPCITWETRVWESV